MNGFIDQGTYVGNGADNRNITGVGFEPEYVITFSSNAQEATQHSGAIGAAVDNSMFFAGIAGLTNRVQALQADGFQVGSALDVNENTRNHFYIAWTRIQGPPRMISGSYTGNATDNRAITGLDFRPDFVIVKGETAQTGVFRSSRMYGDASKPATGATALTANLVQTLNADGFTIGTDARVNGSGVVYQWIAFSSGAGEMVVNNYTGNGADNRSITGLGFQPEYVIVMPESANDVVHRSSTMTGDISFEFDLTGSAANLIQALEADGFQVGTDARVNTNGIAYQYVAWNRIAGKMEVGSYTGNATDNRSITGVGFQPEYVIVRPSSANSTVQHSNAMGASTDQSERFWASVGLTNAIQSLDADGFQVGTDATVNGSGNTYHWMAWKRPVLTAVRMGDMNAVRTATGGAIAWRTGYEVDNLDVYREVGGAHTKLTPKLVAGSALFVPAGIAMPAGHSYSWKDESPVALEKGVQYWIEDIDLNGKRTLHGPIVPTSDKETGKSKHKDENAASPRDSRAQETQGQQARRPSDTAAPLSTGEPAAPSPSTPATNSPLLEELTVVRVQSEEPAALFVSEQQPVAAPPIVIAGAPISMPPAANPRPDNRTPARVPPIESPTVATPKAAASATGQAGTPRATVSGTTESRAATPRATTANGQPVRVGAPQVVPGTSAAAGSAPSDAPPARTEVSERLSIASERLEAPNQVRIVVPQPLRPTAPARLRTRARPLNELVSGSARPDASAEMREQWAIASQYGARISVRTAGWYRLNRAALLSAGCRRSI